MTDHRPVTIYVAFKIGEIVYLKVDPEEKGLVIGYDVRPDLIHYCVAWPGENRYHYEVELTDQLNYVFE